MKSAVPAFTLLSLGPPLSSTSLPVSPQAGMEGPSPCASTIAPAPVALSLDTPALTRVARNSPVAGLLTTVVLVSADFRAGLSSGTGVAIVGRSSSSLISAPFTLFHPCAVVISDVSLPSGT